MSHHLWGCQLASPKAHFFEMHYAFQKCDGQSDHQKQPLFSIQKSETEALLLSVSQNVGTKSTHSWSQQQGNAKWLLRLDSKCSHHIRSKQQLPLVSHGDFQGAPRPPSICIFRQAMEKLQRLAWQQTLPHLSKLHPNNMYKYIGWLSVHRMHNSCK